MYTFKVTFFPLSTMYSYGHSLNFYPGVYSLLGIREKIKEMKDARQTLDPRC